MARVNLAEFMARNYDDSATVVELADGSTITLPPADMWPDEAYEAAREGDIKSCVILALGQSEYDRLCAAGGNWRILNAIVTEQQGLDVGESQASSKSSESSATPSNATSSASTKSTSRRRSAPRP